MSKLIDLTGQRFGRWTVIERVENKCGRTCWKCRCDCGKTKDVYAINLTRGLTQSCGCLQIEELVMRTKERVEDLTGKRYGKLVVLCATEERYSNGSIKWKCRCDCGKIYYSSSSDLKTRRSCGCKTRLINLTGSKFGRLTVIGRANDKKGKTYWHCVCECGTEKEVCASHLTSGRIVSCGCSSFDRISELNKTHGMTNTRLYNIWCGMHQRCYNKNLKNYRIYGGRGITVCQEWLDDFMNFYNWAMENGYADNLSIDRIDVNGNYEPSNCRWATDKEQSCNTRRTRIFEHNGEMKSLKQIAEDEGINYNTLLKKVPKDATEVNTAIYEIKTKRKKE